ncbi:MAG: endolytic transglycosylase MltG [Acidobacteriota bacterium]|nr:endolytic transglycosylase MltG [Acidobacteriota bacterium]
MTLKIIKRALFLAVLIFLSFSIWFAVEFLSLPKTPQKNILFEIEKGSSVSQIASLLKEKEIIKKKWVFLTGYKLFFSRDTLKSGEYSIELPVSTKNILRTLIEGKIYLHPITIPEGLTQKEIASHLETMHIISAEDFLRVSSDPSPILSFDDKASDLEGYLFPETYHFPKGVTGENIVKTMVDQFKAVFSIDWRIRAKELGFSVREVVILASLIEKETSFADEKKFISAVFHNRLKRRMKLDCDPTIIYALKQQGAYSGRLRWKDLKLDSPYNTYIYPGLPPGPIANPGRESLQAALFPADVNYLYFVSKNDGTHIFSRTLKEHQKAVIKYQIHGR